MPYPTDYRPAFAFSGILYPLVHPLSLRSGYHPKMGTVGFTQLIEIETYRGEVGLYSPVERTGAAAGRDRSGGPFHIAFWLRPVSLFGRFGVTSPMSLHVRSTFHVSPAALRPEAGRAADIVPGASHLGLPRSMSR